MKKNILAKVYDTLANRLSVHLLFVIFVGKYQH